jgi:hypothetical protein
VGDLSYLAVVSDPPVNAGATDFTNSAESVLSPTVAFPCSSCGGHGD